MRHDESVQWTRPKLELEKDAALDWCNGKRAEQGKDLLSELPKGKPGDPDSCPCGVATGWRVTNAFAYFGARSEMLPSGVREFTIHFDRGLFPGLETW